MRCVGKTRVTGGIDQHGKSGTRKSMEKKRDENVCLRERERERLKKRERKLDATVTSGGQGNKKSGFFS